MELKELDKKCDMIIKEKFMSDFFSIEPFNPDENELLMIIPLLDKKQVIINIPDIKKSEIEIQKHGDVVFIDLSLKTEIKKNISQILDKLCYCCRNRYLLEGVEKLQNIEVEKNKTVPFVTAPDLVFTLPKEVWEKIKDKKQKKLSFNIVAMPYDILTDDEDDEINRFGRNITVVNII